MIEGLKFFMHGDLHCGGVMIARDEADAWALLVSQVGEEDARDQLEEGDGWREWQPDEVFEICHVDEPGRPVERKPVREWIAQIGRGYGPSWA
ncbi:MAG: hypothetical protein ACO1SX_08185 [Actinomycetota bacterium]